MARFHFVAVDPEIVVNAAVEVDGRVLVTWGAGRRVDRYIFGVFVCYFIVDGFVEVLGVEFDG